MLAQLYLATPNVNSMNCILISESSDEYSDELCLQRATVLNNLMRLNEVRLIQGRRIRGPKHARSTRNARLLAQQHS